MRISSPFAPGAADLASRAELLAERLSDGLRPLAPVAYNYAWSWMRDGEAVFRDINPHRWELAGRNPVRFLGDLWPSTQEAVERDSALLERIESLAEEMSAYLTRPDEPRAGVDGPVAFFCAEFGVHSSLPIYAGGLGVLAGDILKEASDEALPMVGIGLFYRRGYFRQRIDMAGYQQEHWLAGDPKSLPMARMTTDDGSPLLLDVSIFGRDVVFQVWRVDVGRVPLLLLDSELPDNEPVERWTTARLYDGNRSIRLGQYGLLGMGGVRLLRALELDPGAIHLNEGHSALAPLELAASAVEAGADLEEALAEARRRVVFTTHTPVPAGNETYSPAEFLGAFGELGGRLGLSDEAFLGLARVDPADAEEPPGMTVLALRMSGRRNGVSRLHGEVAREMWISVFDAVDAVDVPIGHVTNGVHVPTFVGESMDALFTRHLGGDWRRRTAEHRMWERMRDVPDTELWAARCEARARLVRYVRETSEHDLLLRGEQIEAVRAIAERFDPDALTLGFARRLATYKRLDLLAHDPERLQRLLCGDRPVQLIVAGKAHPSDEEAKGLLVRFLGLVRESRDLAERVVFVEDYDLDVARQLVAGCDVWVNLPRRPLEASGTSGMKATFNGALQLSVLDGWWAEAYDGANGWAIPGDEGDDAVEANAHDAGHLYDLLEDEVIPLFYERDSDGVPREWCVRIKRALVTCGPVFSASRMVDEYAERLYASPAKREPV